MASIYKQADSNSRKTWFLLTGFLVFIIAIGWLFSYLLDSNAILYFAIFLSVFTSFGSYWWSDKIILAMYKAKPIEKKDNPELYRIVENLCITAGLPFPKIFIIPEMQPNAFATGRNAKHAVVAVTQGLLNRLEKSELEGVIAHELSHIGNKDMLLMTVVAILAGIIAMLANLFLRISFGAPFGSGGRKSGNNKDARLGLILMLLGIVSAIMAPIAASLVQLAISRKREFLADASAVLLTRYPEGLARALGKISSDPTPMKISNDATSSLFIDSPHKGKEKTNWFVKLFMTHPPIEDRINALRGIKV